MRAGPRESQREIAKAVRFLAAADSSDITASERFVDGGLAPV